MTILIVENVLIEGWVRADDLPVGKRFRGVHGGLRREAATYIKQVADFLPLMLQRF